MRLVAQACARRLSQLRARQGDAQISLARRIRTLAVCPNFLEVGFCSLKKDDARLAFLSAVVRELDRGFYGSALIGKSALQGRRLDHPSVLALEHNELDERGHSVEAAGRRIVSSVIAFSPTPSPKLGSRGRIVRLPTNRTTDHKIIDAFIAGECKSAAAINSEFSSSIVLRLASLTPERMFMPETTKRDSPF
jgi:hypothetical protein